jgi:Replication-relaxation
MKQYAEIKYFDVEPRFKLGEVEVRPDLYCRWKGNLWFVECQNSRFSIKQIEDKIERYENLFLSGQYKELPFQTDKR